MPDQTILIFHVSGRRFGLPLPCVREVVRAVAVTPLVGAPRVVEGIVDFRGETVPVLDFRARFGLPPRPVEPEDRLITAWTGDRLVAIRADETEWLASLDGARVDPPEQVSPALEGIAGVARLPDGLVLIHDIRTFLAQAEATALDGALAARATDGA